MMDKLLQDKIKALYIKKHSANSVKLKTIYDIDQTKVDEVINDAQTVDANLRGQARRRATRKSRPN
jgi:hypothetical protein